MIDYKSTDTYIDTLGLRCVCYGKYDKDSLFNKIIAFIKGQHIVGILYDTENSN